MAQAMGMNILAYKRQYDASSETDSLHFTDLDTLYKNADIISIHCPLNEETRGMINQNALAQMKDSTILLNTARGGILNEIDVAKALTSGKLYMVGIDVLSEEPPRKDNPLFSHPKCIVTPHVAWAAKETRMRLMEIAADNFYAYLEGHPQNIVHL
ncbi:MAG: NAD(P)-dependent oxidoreductase, partial [Oscillospiraceae bacterium]